MITHVRKLEDARHINCQKAGNGAASRTSIALTHRGRAAHDADTEALRDLLAGHRPFAEWHCEPGRPARLWDSEAPPGVMPTACVKH